jgi:ketosteroid isomerase-like protein
MYHTIVKRIATKNFERVNDNDYDALLKDCAPNIHHRFAGQHALGGERHDRETLRRWFQRLGRLCPTLKLTVHDVWVTPALDQTYLGLSDHPREGAPLPVTRPRGIHKF